MPKLYLLLAITFTAFISFSCSGENKSESAEAALPSDMPGDLIDTTDFESAVPEEAPAEPEAPKVNLPTTDSQLTYMGTSENWERYETGILPQMAEDAPEYCRQILESDGKRFIVVDKAKMKLFLYDPYGNIEKSYGIACAKNYGTKHKKGDSRTTEGIFKVKGVFDSTEWLFTDDNGYTSPKKGQYGPRFIRLNIPYIGIHGTGSPGSIGKRCSHGCIRVTNANIMELVKYVEEGMPVIISPGPKDMAVNKKEGSNILAVASEPGGRPASAAWETKKAETTDTAAPEAPVDEGTPSETTAPEEQPAETPAEPSDPAEEPSRPVMPEVELPTVEPNSNIES